MAAPPHDCPWDAAVSAWGWLDDGVRNSGANYCEAPVCGWIETPANAHSSWAYALIGMLVLIDATRRPGNIDTRAIGLIAVWLGLGSFFMHASLTFAGQLADLLGMFLIASWAAGQNLLRLGALSTDRSRVWVTLALVVGSELSMLIIGRGFPAVLLIGGLAIVVELRLSSSGAVAPGGYRPFAAALGCLALSFVFWGADLGRVGCDPDDHLLQGHAAWHLVNAPLFWLLHRFYAALPTPGGLASSVALQREAGSHTR